MTIVTRGHGQNLVRTGQAVVVYIGKMATLYDNHQYDIVRIRLNDGSDYAWVAEKRDVEIYSKKVVR